MSTTIVRSNGRNPFIDRELSRRRNVAGLAFAQTGGTADTAEVTPEEAAIIRRSVASREQAPSAQQQTGIVDWRKVADTLGDPYNVERIPISKLRMMRRDPIIGFGLSFIKTPHLRARWYINAKDSKGPNAQIAAHLDYDLRRIFASFVLQWCNSLDFGFQSIAKRFEFHMPAGTYVQRDPSGSVSEQPIWSQGSVQPIGWKTFVALAPETVEPIWDGQGAFSGIDYDATVNQGSSAPPPGAGAKGKGQDKFKIDLPHSLWITNERDQNFGSVFGYPRLGYSYRFWWSYWFRWAIADRAFEKKADPSILIYHPEGQFLDGTTGQKRDYSDYALEIGNRMRSGGVITLPSDTYESVNGPTNIRRWEIDFTRDMVNFDPFDKSFDYLDIGKVRSLWIPEQSLMEGKGGTSSRNVAAEMGSSFTESQAVMSVQIAETTNRWVIPQWLAVNYPEFVAAGGMAEIIIQGFADEDVAFTQQIIQLIGQQEQGVEKLLTLVDLQKVLDDAGVPLVDVLEQQRLQAEILARQQALNAPTGAVQPTPGPNGNVGVVPAGPSGVPTANGQPPVSNTGFTYIQPREVIYLSDNAQDKSPTIKVKREKMEDGKIAHFDPDENVVYISEDATEEEANRYLTAIGEALTKVA